MADRYGVLTNLDGTVHVVYSDDNYHWHPIGTANPEWADTIATALNQVTHRPDRTVVDDIVQQWASQPQTVHHDNCWRYHASCAIAAIIRHLEETA